MPAPVEQIINAQVDRPVAIEISNVTKTFKLYSSFVLGPIKEILFFWRAKSFYTEFRAVDDVSFKVYKGEVVGILGANGAGKTTLLKVIAGLLSSEHGEINLKGKVTALLALGVGIHGDFTGRENILYSGMLMGLSKKDVLSKIDSIIEFSELGDFIERPFKTYSSGMRSRLLFSIAMSIDPEILIVDEALATGDVHFVRKSLKRIRDIKESGATILFVSHNINQIREFCDRCLLMHKGKLIGQGETEAVVRQYNEKFVASMTEQMRTQLSQSELLPTETNGQVLLKGIKLLGRDRQVGESFVTGEALTIEISLTTKEVPEDGYHLFIGFLKDNQYIGHLDTENLITPSGLVVEPIRARNRITIDIKHLVTLNGNHTLWVWLYNAKTRETLSQYRGISPFFSGKRDHPFDADTFFAQPVESLTYE